MVVCFMVGFALPAVCADVQVVMSNRISDDGEDCKILSVKTNQYDWDKATATLKSMIQQGWKITYFGPGATRDMNLIILTK